MEIRILLSFAFLQSGATSTIKVKFQSNRFHLFSCEYTVYQVFSI